MAEKLTQFDVEQIVNQEPGLAAVLSWFDAKARFENPLSRQINNLFTYYEFGLVTVRREERFRIATELLEDVWLMGKDLPSGSQKIDHATTESIQGNPEATRTALELYSGDLADETREHLLAVSHLVAAAHEGVDEDFNIDDSRGKGLDHLSAGIMYLARAIKRKASSSHQTEPAETTS